MGDPFFHLGFTRRLRFYDGLHPFAVQTLVRHPLPAAVTATLPGLPALDQAQSGFFKRLLGRGRAENLRWEKNLSESEAPYADYLMALLQGGETGAMFRLSAALGALSQRALVESTRELTAQMDAKERRGTERGVGRIWLQMNIPSLRELGTEWRSAIALDEPTAHQKILTHVSKALKQAYGEAPSAELLVRWVRALVDELRPISERGGLPPQGSVPEHEVRSRFFEGDGVFLERVQSAKERFVFLANELCNAFLIGEPETEQVREALFDANGDLRNAPERLDFEEDKLRWQDQVCALRADALLRGRNSQPAFYGSQDMPPLPADASGPHAHAMPPVPKLTQELSLADVELELSGATLPEAPEETQPISLASIEEEQSVASASAHDAPVPRAPAVTQALSLEDIEEEISHSAEATGDSTNESAAMAEEATDKIPAAPAMTQSLSLENIEEEISGLSDDEEATIKSPVAPAETQALSLEDIEEEVAERSGESAAPAAPAMTQTLSMDDIEEEISARHFVEVGHDVTELPSAPEQTQSIDTEDIEDEAPESALDSSGDDSDADVASASHAKAPAETQALSLEDIEEEISESIAAPTPHDSDAPTSGAEPRPDDENAQSAGSQAQAGDDEDAAFEAEPAENASAESGTPDEQESEAASADDSDAEVRASPEDAQKVVGDSEEAVLQNEDSAAQNHVADDGEDSNRDRVDPTHVGPRPVSIPPSEPEVLMEDEAGPQEVDEDEAVEDATESSDEAGVADVEATAPAATLTSDAADDGDAAGGSEKETTSAPAEDDATQKAQ